MHATAPAPGAIAVLQLLGEGGEAILQGLTAVADWPIGLLRLTRFGEIDDGLVVRLTEEVAQIMPHGGVRVVQRLLARLLELGAVIDCENAPLPRALYPEATDDFEALMLLALSRAASPLAVNLLLDQPRRWRAFTQSVTPTLTDADYARSKRLNRLITPPLVALVGAPNVGKSTLTNALHGRAVAITADRAGTTRDYTAGRLDLGGLVVDWHDTPGVSGSDDPIEQRAIAVAQRLLSRADLIVSLRDHEHDWIAPPFDVRHSVVHVMNKLDVGDPGQRGLSISAVRGDRLEQLVATVRDRLVEPDDLVNPGPWLFDSRLLHVSCDGR